MRLPLIAVLLTTGVFASSPSDRSSKHDLPAGAQTARAADRELDNVAAFARLYGVVRYFFPSDAAASLDWNQFAVDGVERVRPAMTAAALESALEGLFTPLGPGIEIGATLSPSSPPPAAGQTLVAWRYLGPGFDGPGISYSPYRGKRTNRIPAGGGTIDGFVTLMQTVPGADLAGKRIRLHGQVRVKGSTGAGSAALWLRVDRPDGAIGFFDNMGDRPITAPAWREYRVEGPVAADATSIAFGIMASGAVAADFDAIELSAIDSNDAARPIPIKDAGFEDTGGSGWMRTGTSKFAEVSRPAAPAPEGRRFARLSGATAQAEPFEDAPPPAPGDHADVDLGLGLRARIPLVLSETEAAAAAKESIPVTVDRRDETAVAGASEPPDLNRRLADVVVAWNVFRHFYPYWGEAGTDWDSRLRPRLEGAYAANSREAQREALRLLVADARDGHGGVNDTRNAPVRSVLPVRLGFVEDQVVVTASGVPSDAPVGALVSTIDGTPAVDRLRALMRLASGTTQWQRVRALQEMTACPAGTVVPLAVQDAAGSRAITLRCDAKQAPLDQRPQPVTELTPGIWYVDLTRARMLELTPRLEQLARATGVVFDVRGYPTDAGSQILPHLIDSSEADRWMHIAKITGPFGRSAGWQSVGWNMAPRTPRLSGKIVFLTDGRAISYAESVMGYVADRKLGTIVGSATAGANGNVAMFAVPGGFNITFTGMRVTGHDGQTPHHLAGVKPDVPLSPTIAGLRAGRDEVLERGVALASERR